MFSTGKAVRAVYLVDCLGDRVGAKVMQHLIVIVTELAPRGEVTNAAYVTELASNVGLQLLRT